MLIGAEWDTSAHDPSNTYAHDHAPVFAPLANSEQTQEEATVTAQPGWDLGGLLDTIAHKEATARSLDAAAGLLDPTADTDDAVVTLPPFPKGWELVEWGADCGRDMGGAAVNALCLSITLRWARQFEPC